MEFVFDERSANSPLVEMIWHTHSERAGTESWSQVLKGDLITAKPDLDKVVSRSFAEWCTVFDVLRAIGILVLPLG
jgi:hypothetical protein